MRISRLEGAVLFLTAVFLAFSAGWLARGALDAPPVRVEVERSSAAVVTIPTAAQEQDSGGADRWDYGMKEGNNLKILVVDDEKVLVKGMKFNLQSEGYQVETAYDGESAVELARGGAFDLIILDLMMPKIDGLQACMRIREFSNVPIIMLTARSEDADKIMGFECGADDYITKPFNILELKARVRALLRRAGMTAQKERGSRLFAGHITLDPDERSVWKGKESVELTAKEFDLMELLMRNPGRVYSRESLLNVVWGYEYAGDYRTVDVHVRRLREKLEMDPAHPAYILTKWGVGYYLKNS